MNRVLFWVALLLAGLMTILVVLCPFLGVAEQSEGWLKIPALFAHDGTVRQTALASAVGLVVAAVVFFRRIGRDPGKVKRRRSVGQPRTGTPMGA